MPEIAKEYLISKMVELSNKQKVTLLSDVEAEYLKAIQYVLIMEV